MKKVKIIFDFDHTLFSTKKLYEAFKASFKESGVEGKLFQETFNKSKGEGNDWKPKRQFKLICKIEPKIKVENLEKLFKKTLKQSSKFLYKDTVWLLEKRRNKDDLILLSYGEEKFKRRVIEKSKIGRFFEKIIVTGDVNKTKPFKKLFQDDEKIIFVEDNPEALFEVKKKFPKVITVRINRGEGKYSKEKNNKNIDFSIKNLKELEKILREKI